MKPASRVNESSSSSSFKLVNSVAKDDDPACPIPVSKYVSTKTGMNFYLCPIDGPVVEGYFSLATEALDDDGLPHTLEHMIFLGSEDYPYAGVLDLLANKVFAAGTNAWTDVDNTTYTLSTIEKTGFLQLLPIYLDHIFFPLLNESGYVTEVYHINGEGEDAGVVYSEMQSIENQDETIVERAIHKAIYPNQDCGYRYETGGALKNLRTSTSYQKVCDYHKKMYKPENMAIIIAGQVEAHEVIEVLEKFEQKILSKNPESWKLVERPFTRPILPLTENIEQTVFFPSDAEESANGIVAIAWRGPNINHLKELLALDLLFSYLSESSISPLHEHFIDKTSYCSKISYQIEEYRETYLCLNFTNTQVQHMDKVKPELFKIFDDIAEKRIPFNIERMRNLIKMKISELNDKFEDSPHDTISKVCIGDFLYGIADNNELFKTRFSQTQLFETLLKEADEAFWIRLLKQYLIEPNWVYVKAKPCEKLMHSIGEEDEQRVEERKKQLGKKGLKELKTRVENAVDQNDDYEVPDVVYKKIKVPSLENVKLKTLKQFFTYDCKKSETEKFAPIEQGFHGLVNLQHLQMQVDHLEGTQFAQVVMMIDTSSLTPEQRKYLLLFINLLFELPITAKDLKLSHEEVVFELNRDLMEFEATIGVNGSDLTPGSFPHYLSIFTKVPIKDYELAVKWLKLVVFNSVFDVKQIQVTISNLLKDIKDKKQQPNDLLGAVGKDLNYEPDSNLCLNLFVRQENFLKEIEESLAKTESPANSESILQKLEDLRSSLLKDKQLRFYVCADLERLHAIHGRPLDQIWLEHFPSKQSDPSSIFTSNQPFDVFYTWKMRKNYTKRLSNTNGEQPKIWAELPKRDYAINLGSTESAYLRLTSTIDIHSYSDSNYAPLLVLIEYFTQAEGPLYEAVRGPGYCYHQSISLNPETAQLDLFLDECSNPVKAYEATRAVFSEHSNNRNSFEAQLLEAAKNSLIFLLIDDLKSVSNYATYSMCNLFKGVALNQIRELIKKIEQVEIKDLRKLLKTYIMPLFNDEHSNCLLVCHPAKTESIVTDFSEMFDRKLNALGKIDECLCSLAAE